MNNSLKKWLIISVIVNVVLLVTTAVSLTLLFSRTPNTSENSEEKVETEENVPETVIGLFYCATETLNVREEPSQTSTKLGILVKNQKVSVVQFYDEWAKIEFNDAYGYVKKEYLSEKKAR